MDSASVKHDPWEPPLKTEKGFERLLFTSIKHDLCFNQLSIYGTYAFGMPIRDNLPRQPVRRN